MWKYKSHDNFINFLDSFQKKPQIDYFDMVHIINASQLHYYESNYHQFYPARICSQLNAIPRVPLFIPPQHPIKMEIDCSVQSIRDLILLLDKYQYNPEIEYNIDLKHLHEIRPELIQLNNMIGLESLKTSILDQLMYFLQEPILCENNRGYKHTVLCGPPGTGKTEIAKIIGTMYSKMGVLSNNSNKKPFVFKKVTRSDLVGGYLGQTALKTKDVILECLGGCLFIDEAYSLGNIGNNDIFSKECIDTLCEALSHYKDNLMVIIAGYETELKDQFFSANTGLESRFMWKFTIDHYSPSELRQIFEKKIRDEGWIINIDEKIQNNWFEKNKKEFKHYGRDMEQLLLHTKIVHSRRIYGKSRELCKKITMEDLENGHKKFVENQYSTSKMPESMYGLYC